MTPASRASRNNGTLHSGQSSMSSNSPPPTLAVAASSPTVKYRVLYYRQTRKVHKSKGVSKSDGILSINTQTDVVSLFDDESVPPCRPLYSSLNTAIAKRSSNLENEENVSLGGYELDIIGKASAHCPAPPTTSKPLVSFNKQPVSQSVTRRRLLVSHKRPHAATITQSQQQSSSSSLKVARTAPPGRGVGVLFSSQSSRPPSSAALPPRPANANYRMRRAPPAQPRRPTHPVVAEATSIERETQPSQHVSDKRRQDLLLDSPLHHGEGTNPKDAAPLRASTTTKRKSFNNTTRSSQTATRVVAPLRYKVSPTWQFRSATSTRQPPNSTAAPAPAAEPNAAIAASASILLSHIPLPARVLRVLRPHQVAGVAFLHRALRDGGGAILADEPGLGKTLMTIAVIAALHRQQRHKHFCVVCPSSLVGNWVKEFDHWLGPEGQPKRVPLKKGDPSYNSSSMKSFLCSKVGQVVIMSYDLFRIHSHHFSAGPASQTFALLVVDEGHRLKNTSGSLTLSALEELLSDARLLLSATPIQNNLGEFYALSNFCCPGVLGDLHEFRQRFERPILAAAKQSGPPCAAQLELDQITSTFMLRRLQKDVLQSILPPRTEVLLFCRPTPLQCRCYQEIVTAASGSTDALSALTSLRKVCSHPVLYEASCEDGDSHHSKHGIAATTVELSGKLLVLQALLQSVVRAGDSSKVVVVSNFTSALSLVETLLLQPLGYSYVRLDGSTSLEDRQSLVDRFNKYDIFCFLLSSKAGGCGINLVGANRLVLLDPSWNPADDIQAMGRIYRQGQTRSTTIYRFFTSGTVEEVIYQRQLRKENLASIIDKRSSNFSREEINDCFTLKADCDCDTKQKLGPRWPSYGGPESLRALGCSDVPLLEICKGASETLRWVHVVQDNGEKCDTLLQEDRYDSANEEEFEFGTEPTEAYSINEKRRAQHDSCFLEDSSDSDTEGGSSL